MGQTDKEYCVVMTTVYKLVKVKVIRLAVFSDKGALFEQESMSSGQ